MATELPIASYYALTPTFLPNNAILVFVRSSRRPFKWRCLYLANPKHLFLHKSQKWAPSSLILLSFCASPFYASSAGPRPLLQDRLLSAFTMCMQVHSRRTLRRLPTAAHMCQIFAVVVLLLCHSTRHLPLMMTTRGPTRGRVANHAVTEPEHDRFICSSALSAHVAVRTMLRPAAMQEAVLPHACGSCGVATTTTSFFVPLRLNLSSTDQACLLSRSVPATR